jgi:Flp pilus assembly pilin Flp
LPLRFKNAAGNRAVRFPSDFREAFMKPVLIAVRRLVAKEKGQDLLEYGLLAALIAIVAMTAITTVGTTIFDLFWRQIANVF